MAIDRTFLLEGLLQHNYFPMQRKRREEIPPVLSTTTFTPAVARSVLAGSMRTSRDFRGYDAVDYKLTRFNGISRTCSIPHPAGYADLAVCLADNWGALDHIQFNSNSSIRPIRHRDGRIIIMDYEQSLEKSRRKLKDSFGCRFEAHTDISNCFPSIYSHAVAWAAVGFQTAKAHSGPQHRHLWYNQLDEKLRKTKRNETQGIAIGPATSNIVAELILKNVDQVLQRDFTFKRYIDDYTAYCKTEEQAQLFFRRLSEELAKYKLLLNARKTEVKQLPHALTADWIGELHLRLPKTAPITSSDAIHFLNIAVQVAQSATDGSVIKYALKSIVNRQFAHHAVFDVLDYALTLSFHQVALLPLLESLLDATVPVTANMYSNQLLRIALENANYRRSDGMAWSLYYLRKYGIPVTPAVADKVLESEDCIALLLLYQAGNAQYSQQVVQFATNILGRGLYDLDQYWLLLYKLFCDRAIPNPYPGEDCFTILKNGRVVFS
jgi:hypothetical protein